MALRTQQEKLAGPILGSPIRVLLMLDGPAHRRVQRVLSRFSTVELVGNAGEGVDTLSTNSIIMDADLPGVMAFETTRVLKKQGYEGAIILLSADDKKLEEAILAGATGFVTNDAPDEELVSVVLRSPGGGFLFGGSVAETAERSDATGPSPAVKDKGADGVYEDHGRDQEAVVGARQPTSGTSGTESIGGRSAPKSNDALAKVELHIPPPVDLGLLLRLHEWLRGVGDVDIYEMSGSRDADTVLTIQIRQHLSLVPMLRELPYVSEVSEDLSAETKNVSPGRKLLGSIPESAKTVTLVRRLRLTLRAEGRPERTAGRH